MNPTACVFSLRTSMRSTSSATALITGAGESGLWSASSKPENGQSRATSNIGLTPLHECSSTNTSFARVLGGRMSRPPALSAKAAPMPLTTRSRRDNILVSFSSLVSG